MPKYGATFTWFYEVDAEDEDDAEEKAFDLAYEEFGKYFAKHAGFIVEEM